MQERGTIMKQDRRSTKLSDDDVETLDIPDGVELEEILAEVLSGLSEGDTVYYRYADTLEYSFVK